MPTRVSTQSTFTRVLLGIRANQLAALRSQEQLASGRRILRPSDDPTGAARALSLARELADVGRYSQTIELGLSSVDGAASALQDATGMLAEGRAVLIQALNGTLSDEDRAALATEIEGLRAQLLELGNRRIGDRYLFGGTNTDAPPFQEVTVNGERRVVYVGNDEEQLVRVGEGSDLALNVSGRDVFAALDYLGTSFAGLTGVVSGTTADQGTGNARLQFRHDATDLGALAGAGLALVAGGARDTLLGDQSVRIDVAAGTIQLGSGPVRELPAAGSEGADDFVLVNELGGELHLDFTGFTPSDVTATVRGEGSVSLNGGAFTALDFTEADLTLRDQATGTVLHLDTTGVQRAGAELVTFEGTTNVFDVLAGIAADLENTDGLDSGAVRARLEERLGELDRTTESIGSGLGVLGSRGARLRGTLQRLADDELFVQSRLSNVRDTDLSEAAIDLARSDLLLQTAQAAGVRLLQTTLLNFLG